jgi:hypothetical protein
MPDTTATATALIKAVERDTRDGLGEHLHWLDFRTAGPFADHGALIDEAFGVVQWELEGIDDGPGFHAMWPTGKKVTVSGLTVVNLGQKPWTFHRHVDWNGLNTQLGGSRGRSSSPILIKGADEARYLAALHHEIRGHSHSNGNGQSA